MAAHMLLHQVMLLAVPQVILLGKWVESTHIEILTRHSTHHFFRWQNITLCKISHMTFLALICANFNQKSLNWRSSII